MRSHLTFDVQILDKARLVLLTISLTCSSEPITSFHLPLSYSPLLPWDSFSEYLAGAAEAPHSPLRPCGMNASELRSGV